MEKPKQHFPVDVREIETQHLSSTLRETLRTQKDILTTEEANRFLDRVFRTIESHQLSRVRMRTLDGPKDIITWINVARAQGEMNEAIWRCFLAAHFGRVSATNGKQQSSSQFLCAFGSQPFWTWNTTSENRDDLKTWLCEMKEQLATIRFGRHRKYESNRPEAIFATLDSFITMATRNHGPQQMLSVKECESDIGFDVIFRRLRPLVRFGRTAKFDFLMLTRVMELFPFEPRSCYLQGATGPLKGAKLIWGPRSTAELELMAAELVEKSGLSAAIIEDAICNWHQ